MENKFNLKITKDEYGVKIKSSNGGYIIAEIDDKSIYIDQIDFTSREEGKQMLDELEKIAACEYDLPIDIIALPGYNEKITEEELKEVLEDMGFDLHPDDVDHTYYRLGWAKNH